MLYFGFIFSIDTYWITKLLDKDMTPLYVVLIYVMKKGLSGLVTEENIRWRQMICCCYPEKEQPNTE